MTQNFPIFDAGIQHGNPHFFIFFWDVSMICEKTDGRGGVPLHSATFLQPFLIWGNGQLAGLSQISSMVCSLNGTSPQEGMDIQLAHRISPRKVVKTHDFEKKKPTRNWQVTLRPSGFLSYFPQHFWGKKTVGPQPTLRPLTSPRSCCA